MWTLATNGRFAGGDTVMDMQSLGRLTLGEYLERHSETGPLGFSVATAVDAIATACIEISRLARGASVTSADIILGTNADGDVQKDLDISADWLIRRALASASIAAFASEEAAKAEFYDPTSRLCVAVDPLDGSSNLNVNMSVGTIFSITPAPQDASQAFRRRGTEQIAAGFAVYGPQTSFVLTLGDGVDIFTLDPADATFKLAQERVRIPADASEFAINASNQRHWDPPVRAFIDECLAGVEGPAETDFNMRWIASLVAEVYRILARGGVFLYPADNRDGYGNGRLRLVYEAHPMAFIVEQAGGAASTGRGRVLDLVPESLHQRVPLILGSSEQVRRIEQFYAGPGLGACANAPLFAHRGFFRV
jgi:fructose-1,6-bisphosphatase I